MNLNAIRRVLESEQIQLTKSLGQNFLHDAAQLNRIVAAAGLTGQEHVLEIGPGLGALTQQLIEKAPHVLAIEKDRRLIDFLRKRFAAHPALSLVHADALDFLRGLNDDWSEWKLVSNLPYCAASAILVELAKATQPPARITVTLQLEVAQRLAAAAGRVHYGVLTLLVQLRYEIVGMFKIPPGCFFPVPEIDSACVTLVRRPAPLLAQAQIRTFEKLVKRGFSQRRKMMLKLLKADWPLPKLEAALAGTGIALQARAETVTLEQFVQLTKLLAPSEATR